MNSENPPPDSNNPFDKIVDDAVPRDEAFEWASQQMLNGATPESLVEQLIAEGWASNEAEELVEEARKATRSDRGVLTREEVSRQMNQSYRKAMGGGLLTGFPTIASLRRLLYSLASLKFLRRK